MFPEAEIMYVVDAIMDKTGGVYTDDIMGHTGYSRERITRYLKKNGFKKSGGITSKRWEKTTRYFLVTEEELDGLDMLTKDQPTHGGETDQWLICQNIRGRELINPPPEMTDSQKTRLNHKRKIREFLIKNKSPRGTIRTCTIAKALDMTSYEVGQIMKDLALDLNMKKAERKGAWVFLD